MRITLRFSPICSPVTPRVIRRSVITPSLGLLESSPKLNIIICRFAVSPISNLLRGEVNPAQSPVITPSRFSLIKARRPAASRRRGPGLFSPLPRGHGISRKLDQDNMKGEILDSLLRIVPWAERRCGVGSRPIYFIECHFKVSIGL